MASLRRQKGLTPCSVSSSSVAPLQGVCDDGTALERPDNVHLTYSNNVVQPEEKVKHTIKRSHGTCIVTVVTRNAIYTIGDGRCTSTLEDNFGEVVEGNRCKLHVISRYLLATTAGDADDSIDLLNHVIERAKKMYNLLVIKKIINNYLKDKRSRNEIFKATVNVFGYHHGCATMYSSDKRSLQRLNVGALRGSGSGAFFAGIYLKMYATIGGEGEGEEEELYRTLERSEVFASHFDPSVGGHFRVAKISNKMRSDVQIERRSHILKVFGDESDDYDMLLPLLSMEGRSLLVLSFNMEYDIALESWVIEQLKQRFDRKFTIRVLAYDWMPFQTVVRVLLFDQPLMGLPELEVLYENDVAHLRFETVTAESLIILANRLSDDDY